MPDKFYGDETLHTSHETLSFSLLVMSAKFIIFNVMKLPLRLALLMHKCIEIRWGILSSFMKINVLKDEENPWQKYYAVRLLAYRASKAQMNYYHIFIFFFSSQNHLASMPV